MYKEGWMDEWRGEGDVGERGRGSLRGVSIRWMQGGRKTPFVCLAPVYFYLEQAADH